MATSNHPQQRLSDLTRAQIIEQQSIDFTKYLSCLADTRGARIAASEMYLEKFPESLSASTMRKALEDGDLSLKAAIAPGTSTDAVWAKPLAGVSQVAAGFLKIAHLKSVVGRAGLTEVPFNTKIPFQTADPGFAFIAENEPYPVSNSPLSDGITVAPAKVGGIVVVTQELARLAVPGTARTLRDTLIGGLNAYVDGRFLNPAVTAVAGKKSASITNGTTPITGTGVLSTDLKTLIAAFFAGRPGAEAPVLIANGGNAAAIRGMIPSPGLDVYASEGAGVNVVMLDPAAVFYADGGLEVDYSEYATLQMNTTPDTPPTAATVPIPLWQFNLVGYRVDRFVSWGAAPNAVKYLVTV